MMNILEKVENYIGVFFSKKHEDIYTYHNLTHTQYVVKAAKKIISNSDLSPNEKEIVIIAAWFHDTGYFTNITDHENESAKIADLFLNERSYDKENIEQIKNCIMSTKCPYTNFTCELSNILCDADMWHFADKNFIKISLGFLLEQRNIYKYNISEKIYWTETLEFLKSHHYKTKYGKKFLSIEKKKNIEIINGKLKKYQSKEITQLRDYINKLEQKNDKLKSPQRGIESMFRITARSQTSLSSIADAKASLMISVNSIIISAIFFIFKDIMNHPNFIIPCIILLIVSLITIIYAVLATRPIVSSGTFSEKEIKDKKVNLLFFGNFYKMDIDDYSKAMNKMMENYDELYDGLIKDQYYLGKVLGKKYALIHKSYTIFMFGLIISVLSFIVAAILQANIQY